MGKIRYHKLFDILNRRNMKKTDLLEVISAPTLAKLSKGESVTTEMIEKICTFLECQPGDIMEIVENEYVKTHKNKSTTTYIQKNTISYEEDDIKGKTEVVEFRDKKGKLEDKITTTRIIIDEE